MPLYDKGAGGPFRQFRGNGQPHDPRADNRHLDMFHALYNNRKGAVTQVAAPFGSLTLCYTRLLQYLVNLRLVDVHDVRDARYLCGLRRERHKVVSRDVL